ncbi:MAG TPA: hypothetical protein VFO85_04470, partial [Vicinamibacteria bacterium]|nr:hypothetical protein [Vicinamibacteria bacterium]
EGQPVSSAARLRGARFDAQAPVGPGAAVPLLGADGDVELALDASGLAHGAGVLASEALFPQQPPPGLAAGGAAVIVAGEQPLLKPAELGLRFDPLKVDGKTVQVFRLEGDEWVPLPTIADAETGRARADIVAWGTYAVFGKSAF